MTAVKFCGFTREEDVRAAVGLGCAYLGLNFVSESPRRVASGCASALVAAARDEAERLGIAPPRLVGVFAASPAHAAEQARLVGLDAIQLCGRLGEAPLPEVGFPLIVAVRPRPDEATPMPVGAWAWLVDAHHDTLLGGTGRLADWQTAARLAAGRRVFLAGGLTPANVGEAVRLVRPCAVDVAGGIESAPGIKDSTLMSAFIEAVRRADGGVPDSYAR